MIMKFPLDGVLSHLAKDNPDECKMLYEIVTNLHTTDSYGPQFVIAACTAAYNFGLDNVGLDRTFKIDIFKEKLDYIGVDGLDNLLEGMQGEHRDKILIVLSLFRCCFLYGCDNLN